MSHFVSFTAACLMTGVLPVAAVAFWHQLLQFGKSVPDQWGRKVRSVGKAWGFELCLLPGCHVWGGEALSLAHRLTWIRRIATGNSVPAPFTPNACSVPTSTHAPHHHHHHHQLYHHHCSSEKVNKAFQSFSYGLGLSLVSWGSTELCLRCQMSAQLFHPPFSYSRILTVLVHVLTLTRCLIGNSSVYITRWLQESTLFLLFNAKACFLFYV